MFGKKKEKKEKVKEEKRKDKPTKDVKKKTKAPDAPAEPQQNGYMWGSQNHPQGMPNGYARDQMGEAIYIQKPNSVIHSYEPAGGPKYGPKNLKLVSEKEAKKDKKDKKDKKGKIEKPDKGKGGILKTSKTDKSGVGPQGITMFDPSKPTAPPMSNPSQVTFAGPDNRVHQSVVKISQTSSAKPPDILANNYQTNMQPIGYLAPMYPGQVKGSSPIMHPTRMASPYAQAPSGQFVNNPMMQQQFSGNRLGVPNGVMPTILPNGRPGLAASAPNIAYNNHIPIRATHSDPNAAMVAAEHVKHLQISQGVTGTRHVTSIDVIGKSNQGLAPPLHQHPSSRSSSPFGFARSRSPSPFEQQSAIAIARGGLPGHSAQDQQLGYAYKNGVRVQHNKGPAPAPPIVLAELNIPQNMVPPQQREAYAKFERMVEKVREDDIVYADLLFNKQNNVNKPVDLKREKIANYTIEMDSDEENENPLRIKGILKAPKKVEFNKDVDVTLFGTLSRHESLESLYNDRIHGRDIMAARKRNAPAQYYPQAAPYAEIIEERPLDDTDLYMYTVRRRRAPPVYITRGGYGEGMRAMARHGSLRASGSRGRPSVRTVRLMPGKHAMW